MPDEREHVLEAARALVAATVDDPLARSADLGAPLRGAAPAGGLDSWCVPLTESDRLVGFLQLGPDLVMRRHASFLRRPGSLEGAPPAASWLEPERIRARARELVGEDVRLGEPVLTYDANPDRIAWAVPVESSPRAVFVAGDYAWVAES